MPSGSPPYHRARPPPLPPALAGPRAAVMFTHLGPAGTTSVAARPLPPAGLWPDPKGEVAGHASRMFATCALYIAELGQARVRWPAGGGDRAQPRGLHPTPL